MSGHDHLHAHPSIVRATAMSERSRGRASRATMASLVRDLLDTLDDAARRRTVWPFADGERVNWHYVPRPRAGLAIADMAEDTRALLDALLRHALSEAGYDKATGVRRLEEPLGLLERHRHGGPRRDPLNYSLTVFGRPGHGPWGWRLEGTTCRSTSPPWTSR